MPPGQVFRVAVRKGVASIFKRLACYLYSKPAKFVGCEPTFSDMAAAPAESDLEIVGFSG